MVNIRLQNENRNKNDSNNHYHETNRENRKRVLQMLDLFNSKYKCKVCRKKLRFQADQIIHSKLKHSNSQNSGMIECPESDCNTKHTSYYKLMKHLMIDHLKEKPYGCKICTKKFFSFVSFKRHCKKSHGHANLINIIEYDNSELMLDSLSNNVTLNTFSQGSSTNSPCSTKSSSLQQSFQLKINDNILNYTTNAKIKYTNFLNRIKLSEIVVKPNYIDITDNGLNNTNYHDINCFFHHHQSAKPKKTQTKINDHEINIISSNSISNDDDFEATYSDHIFTIITQFNLKKCSKCAKLFMTNSDFLNHTWKAHMLNGNYPTKFECWSCSFNILQQNNFKFNDEIDLIKHLKSNHLNELPYKCSICSDSYFTDLNSAKLHYHQKHLDSKIKEEYALEENDMIIDLEANDVKNNKNKIKNYKFVFACSHCEQIYSSHDSIIEHFIQSKECNLNEQSSTSKKQHQKFLKCNYCNDIYNNESALNLHLDQHEYLLKNGIMPQDSNDNNISPIIRKTTPIYVNPKTNNNNNNTNNIHNSLNNKSFSIDAIVNSSASNNINRIDNMISKVFNNNSNVKNNFCQLLNQSNAYQAYFNHLKNLNAQNNQKGNATNSLFNDTTSSLSAFSFSTNSASTSLLAKNLNSIINNKNNASQTNNRVLYQSTQKSQSYPHGIQPNSSSSQISNNNREINNQVCDLCGYSFKNLVELEQHKLAHIGSDHRRPIRCHLCKVPFAKRDMLKKHMNIHVVKEKDFVCSQCHSTFSRKQDLDRHMLFHNR